jgi:hypothetical protein
MSRWRVSWSSSTQFVEGTDLLINAGLGKVAGTDRGTAGQIDP